MDYPSATTLVNDGSFCGLLDDKEVYLFDGKLWTLEMVGESPYVSRHLTKSEIIREEFPQVRDIPLSPSVPEEDFLGIPKLH